MYFLAKVDQSYHLNILTRDIFLIIWIVLFVLLGLYLMGKIKFAHDSEWSSIGVFRLLLVIAVFSFALYLFTGLMGNDLKGISPLLPPAKAEKMKAFSREDNRASWEVTMNSSALCGVPEYSDFLELPYGLQGYFNYEEALACAKEKNKPVLVDFVGHTCSNCKKMYEQVWSDPRVLEILKNDFIIVALYTDDHTKLPEKEWITSAYDGKKKTTIGKKNQDFQITRFNSNALPLYAIVDASGKVLTSANYTYNTDIGKFIGWLNEGRAATGSADQ